MRIFNSGKLYLSVYLACVGAMMVGSVVEVAKGSRWTTEHVYGASWFVGLWCVLGGLTFARFWKRWHHVGWGICLLHVGIGIVLLGAMTTAGLSRNGWVHLREGNTTQKMIVEGDVSQEAELPWQIKLEQFEVECYPYSIVPKDWVSHIEIEGKHEEIKMNNPYKKDGYIFVQASVDEDGKGTTWHVNQNRGRWIVYGGYGLFVLGAVVGGLEFLRKK